MIIILEMVLNKTTVLYIVNTFTVIFYEYCTVFHLANSFAFVTVGNVVEK